MSVWGNPVTLGGGGGTANIQALSVTQNGTYTASGGVDGYSPVTVAVPGGGGGSTNVLSGTSDPSASQGRNGAMYLKYIAVPSEYTRLEYIQSDGNQYIDTQYTPTALTSVELKLNPQNVQESAILGANWAMNGFFLMFYQSKFRWHSGSSADSGTVAVNTDYVVEVSNTSLTVDDATYGVSSGSVIQQPIRLFSTTIAGGSGASNTKGRYKLYYCNIYENGVLVMSLLPAKRKSDDEIGLYDSVGGNFYINGGSGNFVAGAEIATSEKPITSAYAKVNGAWQDLIGTDISDIDLGGSGGSTVFTMDIVDESSDSVFPDNVPGYGYMTPDSAVSGTTKRHWWGANNNSQHWLLVEFGTAKVITAVKFSCYWQLGTTLWHSGTVVVQGSNDGSTFTDIATFSSLPESETQTEYSLNNSTTYKYYRFLCTSGGTYYTGLGKIQLFGYEVTV